MEGMFWRFLIRKIHPSYALMAGVIGVVMGMVLVILLRWWLAVDAWWLCAGIALVVGGIVMPRPLLLLLPLVGGMMIAGWRAGFDLAGMDYWQSIVGETVEVTGEIAEDPDLTETKTALRLKNVRIYDNAVAPGTLYIQLAKNDAPERSDIVTLRGKLNEGFGTFAATMYRPSIVRLERPEPGDVLLHVRNDFAGGVRDYIGSPAVDLGLGYLLGVRSSLPESLLEVLKVVGLTHIIVASGANLAILINFARGVFGKLSRWCGFLISLALVLGFVGMVGFTPSMIRAAVVSGLSLVAWYVGRKFIPVRLLLIVAAGTLLYNPMYLLDLGWLLSFAAFGGIMVVGPRLTEFLYGADSKPALLMPTLLETISASLLCVPLLLYTLGQMSLVSLAANLLILPTIPVVMGLVFATGMFAWVWPLAAEWCGKFAGWILDFHLNVMNFFGEQKMFLVQIEPEQAWVFLLYIPIFIPMVVGWVRRRRRNE